MCRKFVAFLYLLIGISLQASEGDNSVVYPWLTGPLLSPFGYVIDTGHMNFEPYLYANKAYGRYNKHWKGNSTESLYNLSTQLYTWFGIAHRWDIEIAPVFSWNHTSGASHWVVNDMPVLLEYQILYEKKNRWYPAIKFALLATIPLGKYQKLNPKDKGTDFAGTGNWMPGAEIVFQRLLTLPGNRYLVLHYTIDYTFSTSVPVKGYNAYGGGQHTRGKVYPGSSLLTILGVEYSINKNWGLSFDMQYLHQNRTRFKGHKGMTLDVPNIIGYASSEQLSLAPAVEYSWSNNLGLIAGAWFSIAGRNAPEFATGIIAINIYK